MPVIGRLDGQVEEVIISPIEKRRRGEEPPASRREEQAPEPPSHAPTHTPQVGESSADTDELPVWLL